MDRLTTVPVEDMSSHVLTPDCINGTPSFPTPQEAPMSETFHPELSELTLVTKTGLIDIYKVGGGQLRQQYAGNWGYRIRNGGRVIAAGEDLHTTSRLDHWAAARLACAIHARSTHT